MTVFESADTVFHLAAISALPVCQSRPAFAIQSNVTGTANVLEAARRAGVRRVVFASTSAVYETNKHFPCREDDVTAPRLVYAMSKQQAELLCHGYRDVYGMEIVITRYYNVYGPQQDIHRKSPPFVGYVIRELLSGRVPVLHSDGAQRRDYVYVEDVNALNIACMLNPAAAGNTFNVASGRSYSVIEIYDAISKVLGTDIRPTFRPAAKFWDSYPELFVGPSPIGENVLADEVNKFTLGSTFHAETVLGWRADTSFEDGITSTIRHMEGLLGASSVSKAG
ncbi:MAG: NAD-dependent epimerase/dehydratase family protein [Methylacidiphilales bacterium]|nr:NAD-dependent epimerase/dehydratase family protein [Candidatus Methylacidiphilales bacterium]